MAHVLVWARCIKKVQLNHHCLSFVRIAPVSQCAEPRRSCFQGAVWVQTCVCPWSRGVSGTVGTSMSPLSAAFPTERLDKHIYFNFVCFARMLCIDGGHARFCYCHRADFDFFLIPAACTRFSSVREGCFIFFPPRVRVFSCPSCTVMMTAMFAAPSSPHPHLPRLCLSPPHVCM